METISLDRLKAGKSGIIRTVGGEGALRRRLLDLGLTPGTPVLVRKVAPLGDPIELNLRGYELTLRKEEAGEILVQPVPEFTAEAAPGACATCGGGCHA